MRKDKPRRSDLIALGSLWALSTIGWLTCCFAAPSAFTSNALAVSFVTTLLTASLAVRRRKQTTSTVRNDRRHATRTRTCADVRASLRNIGRG